MRSTSAPRAVTNTTGAVVSLRSARQTSKPSRPGSPMSSTTTSGDACARAATPPVRRPRESTEKPSAARASRTSSATAGSSSTTSATRGPGIARTIIRFIGVSHARHARLADSRRSRAMSGPPVPLRRYEWRRSARQRVQASGDVDGASDACQAGSRRRDGGAESSATLSFTPPLDDERARADGAASPRKCCATSGPTSKQHACKCGPIAATAGAFCSPPAHAAKRALDRCRRRRLASRRARARRLRRRIDEPDRRAIGGHDHGPVLRVTRPDAVGVDAAAVLRPRDNTCAPCTWLTPRMRVAASGDAQRRSHRQNASRSRAFSDACS